MNNENMYEIELTIPIRFSRQRITELLVAAEHTASFFPCNIIGAKKYNLISRYLNIDSEIHTIPV
jgi:hypothetical protein